MEKKRILVITDLLETKIKVQKRVLGFWWTIESTIVVSSPFRFEFVEEVILEWGVKFNVQNVVRMREHGGLGPIDETQGGA